MLRDRLDPQGRRSRRRRTVTHLERVVFNVIKYT
jgi:hypothetical protein